MAEAALGEFRRVAPDKNEVNDLTTTVARVVEHRLQIWIGGILLHRRHAGDRPFSTCGDCERCQDRYKSGNWQRPLSWFVHCVIPFCSSEEFIGRHASVPEA